MAQWSKALAAKHEAWSSDPVTHDVQHSPAHACNSSTEGGWLPVQPKNMSSTLIEKTVPQRKRTENDKESHMTPLYTRLLWPTHMCTHTNIGIHPTDNPCQKYSIYTCAYIVVMIVYSLGQ